MLLLLNGVNGYCRHPFTQQLLLSTSARRFKTVKFKPKIAKTRPLKAPSMVALDHFDFYYGANNQWPSIRLGLLTPNNKYVTIVNTLSHSWESNDALLNDLGTIDLLPRLIGMTASERIVKKRQKIEQMKRAAETSPEQEEELTLQLQHQQARPELDLESRSNPASLVEFQPSPGARGLGEIQMGRDVARQSKDFEVTGFEGMDSELKTRPHFLYYPRELRVRTYDRACLVDYPPPLRDSQKVPGWWLLDGRSLVPVLALGLEEGDRVLDVCAAPGGKSLAILLTILPGKLVCNDFKLARLGQLKRALVAYIPSEIASAVNEKVILKNKDASNVQTWDEIKAYDKVLADVPCTSDRLSVAQDDGNLFSGENNNLRMSLPEKQTKILVNALRATRVGGSVVYSTCTLSPAQNEAVVENAAAIAKERFSIEVVEESLSTLRGHLIATGLFRFSPSCQRGLLVLPFLPSNFGPMYVCKLTRLH